MRTLAGAGDSGTGPTELSSLTDESRPLGSAWTKWIAAAACLFGMLLADVASAQAETRSLKLYFVHTREKAEIVFKRNGRYDRAGLKRVNNFLRDWRRNEPTNMDPRLLDIVWEAYRQSGSRAYINVVSAYRSPATNSMLRGRSRGVAKKSQHMLGKAMDFYLPDVKLKNLRNIGLKMQAGGVGYYPRSGSPFVHFDVGRVRHWPGIGRSELASVFPNGKTLHVPSDGRPLPGYEQAMSAYKTRQSKGDLAIASLAKGGGSTGKRSGGLLAAWFGGGADEEEDVGESEMPATKAPPKAVAKRGKPVAEEPQIAIRSPDEARPAARQAAGRQAEIAVLPPELAAPANVNRQQAEEPALAEEPAAVETPETIIAALPARNVPMPGFAPRPQVDVGPAEAALAQVTADPVQTASATEVAALIERESTAMPVEESAVADDQIATNVPVPAWRPEGVTPAAEQATALLAAANTEAEIVPARIPPAPVPGLRAAEASVAAADLRGSRPGTDGSISNGEEVRVAAIPSPAPRTHKVANASAQKVAAAPRDTVTTAKSGRVKATPKPEAKPQVVAAAPESAEWALQKAPAKKQERKKKPTVTAENIVRTAPMEVYTAGFQRGEKVKDPNRFTGKAVEFLSVAKFQ